MQNDNDNIEKNQQGPVQPLPQPTATPVEQPKSTNLKDLKTLGKIFAIITAVIAIPVGLLIALVFSPYVSSITPYMPCTVQTIFIEQITKQQVDDFKKVYLIENSPNTTKVKLHKSSCFSGGSAAIVSKKITTPNSDKFYNDFKESMHKQGFAFSDVLYAIDCGQGFFSGVAERNDMSFTFMVYGKVQGECKDSATYSDEEEFLQAQPYLQTAQAQASFSGQQAKTQ